MRSRWIAAARHLTSAAIGSLTGIGARVIRRWIRISTTQYCEGCDEEPQAEKKGGAACGRRLASEYGHRGVMTAPTAMSIGEIPDTERQSSSVVAVT